MSDEEESPYQSSPEEFEEELKEFFFSEACMGQVKEHAKTNGPPLGMSLFFPVDRKEDESETPLSCKFTGSMRVVSRRFERKMEAGEGSLLYDVEFRKAFNLADRTFAWVANVLCFYYPEESHYSDDDDDDDKTQEVDEQECPVFVVDSITPLPPAETVQSEDAENDKDTTGKPEEEKNSGVTVPEEE